MPEAVIKTEPRPRLRKTSAVNKAKEKPLEVTPKFEVMKTPENPAIQQKALDLKKVQKERTELSNEETKLNKELVDLMKAASLSCVRLRPR